MAPKMPNALPRSSGSVKVVVSSERIAGASSAANRPCTARAAISMPTFTDGAADGRGDREAAGADDEHPLAADDVGDAPAEQQQRPERQRVGGDDPLAGAVGEAEIGLRGRQRDVHDGRVEHDHELRDAEDGEDPPAPAVVRCGRRPGRSRLVEYCGHCAAPESLSGGVFSGYWNQVTRASGAQYLHFRGDVRHSGCGSAAGHPPTRIWAQPLSADPVQPISWR